MDFVHEIKGKTSSVDVQLIYSINQARIAGQMKPVLPFVFKFKRNLGDILI